MNLDKYPVLHPQVAARQVEEQAVIVLADSGEVNILNPVGSRVLALMNGRRSVREIAAAIEDEYAVEPQAALNDVQGFIQELVETDVVLLRDSPV